MPLTFDELRKANRLRNADIFHQIGEWSPCDWMTALAGEIGEAANLIKKQRRGDTVAHSAIEQELADAVIYLDLLAARLDVDLGAAVRAKFNMTSEERGSVIRL